MIIGQHAEWWAACHTRNYDLSSNDDPTFVCEFCFFEAVRAPWLSRLELPNRIIMAPLTRFRTDGAHFPGRDYQSLEPASL
jgi:hypothetical protein